VNRVVLYTEHLNSCPDELFTDQKDRDLKERIRLFGQDGHRLYLTPPERQQFIESARRMDGPEYTFCLTLALTGCRISEGLNLTKSRVDYDAKGVVYETLKQRRRAVYRSVPVPDSYLEAMNLVHALQKAQRNIEQSRSESIWPFGRTKGWQIVKAAMDVAGIIGPHATPKGLRHAFAVHALSRGVPLNLIQKWLGHESIETTAIYLQVRGEEEYALAQKMW
jgi:integrase